mmetsp:Transcript_28967/g.86932  ORF Transcript_28967/g.86932 Transcript_28967/m.86932 type:complete len:226 (-) Transcript_28967:812-1489(-)
MTDAGVEQKSDCNKLQIVVVRRHLCEEAIDPVFGHKFSDFFKVSLVLAGDVCVETKKFTVLVTHCRVDLANKSWVLACVARSPHCQPRGLVKWGVLVVAVDGPPGGHVNKRVIRAVDWIARECSIVVHTEEKIQPGDGGNPQYAAGHESTHGTVAKLPPPEGRVCKVYLVPDLCRWHRAPERYGNIDGANALTAHFCELRGRPLGGSARSRLVPALSVVADAACV